MPITLKEPFNSWLAKNLPADANEHTIFTIKLGADTGAGVAMVELNVDLVWFVILYIEEANKIKLEVVMELMQNKILADNFIATLDNPAAKRIIEEFLIFNYAYLDKLKSFIKFDKLNMPIDFISHALFIKHGAAPDSKQISSERLRTINLVLDSGFKLQTSPASSSGGAVLHKVLTMEDVDSIFIVAKRLLAAGYSLFSNSAQSNAEIAVVLLNARQNPDALAIIQQNVAQFKTISLPVAGASENGNLADYYYWVKEDMDAVRFIKDTLGIEVSPTT